MQGYSGKLNYGIAKMNGAYGNRPLFATARDIGWATRWRRDVSLLLAQRAKITASYGFDAETGRALLWLEPWDGVEQLSVNELDPFFIEACRRIRLIIDQDAVVANWTTSKASRIAAKKQRGNLGDTWTPIRIEDGAALTARNLHYARLQKILFGDEHQPSPASIPQPDDGDEPMLACQILARGDRGTEGYHERYIIIPPKARRLLATLEGRRLLSELSRQRLHQIRDVTKVLRRALAALLQGGPDELDLHASEIAPFAEPLDFEIDRIFFRELFEDIELSFEAARIKWLNQLLALARQILDQAEQSTPIPAARVFRARAAAEREFRRGSDRLLRQAGEGATS